MQTLWQDLRYGARMLVKQPGFTLMVLLALWLTVASAMAQVKQSEEAASPTAFTHVTLIDSKASAKAREFEKWCGQNEGDNSAPRMLKNRPAIVPLKTEV